jgi:hypothetical protein
MDGQKIVRAVPLAEKRTDSSIVNDDRCFTRVLPESLVTIMDNPRKYDASRRASYVRVLATQWIKRNRPDIWEEIQKEAIEKIPAPGPPRMGPNAET